MILLGMTGPISHGKTTLADALAALVPNNCHFESSLIIAEVADALHNCLHSLPDPQDLEALNDWLRSLPSILLETVHVRCTFEQIRLNPAEIEEHQVDYRKLIMHAENLQRHPNLAKQTIDRNNKELYRPFLQWLGGYLVAKVDDGIWYNELVRRIRLEQQRGAELIMVGGLRFPSDANILRAAGGTIVKVYRPGHLQTDILDPTERERENIRADCTIMNNGAIDDVKRFATAFLADLRAGRLQSHYQTAGVSVVK